MATQRKNAMDWAALIVLLAVVFVVALLGSAVTLPKISGWYVSLAKPSFNPPNQVFGPVWTILYVLMAVTAWRVWCERGHPGRVSALAWWVAQLALNAAWSQVFFGLEQPGWALVVIVLLLGAVGWTAWRFYAIDAVAGVLLLPYLAWVMFAAVLNTAIVRLN